MPDLVGRAIFGNVVGHTRAVTVEYDIIVKLTMIYIILASVFYTIAVILSTIASRSTNSNVVAVVSNLVSIFIPLAIITPLLSKKFIVDSKYGIIMSILAGIAVGFFTMALLKSYSINKVAIVVPIVFGGAIFLSALAGYIIFKEKISLFQGFGLSLLGIGLILIIYARITGR